MSRNPGHRTPARRAGFSLSLRSTRAEVRPLISRKLLKELRTLEKSVGREGIWAAAEEAESKLPKRGRKPGPIYQTDQAIDRMRSLKAASPSRSWREVARQAGKEFNISGETLRTEERKRRLPVLAATAATNKEPQGPRPKSHATTLPPTVSAASQDPSALYGSLAGKLAEKVQESINALIAQANVGHDRYIEQMVAKLQAEQQRTIDALVNYPDWRKVLKNMGLK